MGNCISTRPLWLLSTPHNHPPGQDLTRFLASPVGVCSAPERCSLRGEKKVEKWTALSFIAADDLGLSWEMRPHIQFWFFNLKCWELRSNEPELLVKSSPVTKILLKIPSSLDICVPPWPQFAWLRSRGVGQFYVPCVAGCLRKSFGHSGCVEDHSFFFFSLLVPP